MHVGSILYDCGFLLDTNTSNLIKRNTHLIFNPNQNSFLRKIKFFEEPFMYPVFFIFNLTAYPSYFRVI